MNFLLAEDMGNDKFKVLEPGMDQVVKFPSVYKRLLKKPVVHEIDVKKNIANLIDQLVVHVSSEAINHDGIYAIGERALQTTEDVRNMNIKIDEKHTSDLPVINTLGYIAARVVQKEFAAAGTLPKGSLNVNVFMSTAIPASQHNIDTARFLENRFMDHTHIVVVYVGKESVTVQIDFKMVKVTKEGVPALYAILDGPEEMFEEFAEKYKLDYVDGSFFVNSKILHTDIGSGTTEYVYTVGVNPRPEQCTGERRGVGHAIAGAIELMKEERKGLSINRQQFAKYIERPEEYSRDHELAVECLRNARINQVEAIQTDIEEKYTTILASEPEFFAVYGGGSIEFKDDMYKPLKKYADSVEVKLLWIPAVYAVNMNVTGLDILNKNIFFKKEYRELVMI